jgi:outer membrane receptor for ferrienterochelin and colicins
MIRLRIIYLAIFLLAGSAINAQSLLKVINKESQEPVPFASVVCESLESHQKFGGITDEKGTIRSCNGLSIVKISCIGFLPVTDTIDASVEQIIYLIPDLIELEDVVVTATAKPQLRDQSIYKIDVISSADIKERAAVNLGDLLSTQSSLRVEQNGSLGSSVRMQGLSGNQVKILIDGVPVIGRVNGNIDLNQLNLQNTDHVEIIEGPMSVIYGSDAMGGVINIISKENNKKSFNASSELYYETVGKYNASIQAAIHSKNHTINIGGSRNFFQGFALDGDSGRVQTWRPRLQYNFDGTYTYSKNTAKLKYSLSLFSEEYRILAYPGKAKTAFDTTDTGLLYHAIAFDSYNYTHRTINKVEYSNTIKNNSLNLVAAYSTFWRSLNTYRNDLTLLQKTTDGVANQDTQTISSVMVRGLWSNDAIKNLEFFGGTEFNFDHAVDKTDFGTKEMTDLAGFLNLKYSPFESLSFQPGLRVIYNSLFSAPVVYALNLKFQPDHHWSARVSFAKGYRSPTLKELYFKYTALDHMVNGNPDLKPEYSNNTNAAIIYTAHIKNSELKLNLSGFYNQIKNKIDYLQDPYNELKATLINLPIELYKNFGGNFITGLQLNESLNIEGGLGITAVSTLKNASSFTYSENYTGGVNYRNKKSMYNISVNYKFFGNYIIYSAELLPDGSLNVTSETLAGGYHNMDALVNKQLLHNKIDLGIGVKNIFDNTRIKATGSNGINNGGVSAGLVGYGRSYFIKLSYRFN